MTYPPREGDQPFDIILDKMEHVARHGGQAYVKWTCPGCGERCIADEANSIHLGGYLHEECGEMYLGDVFGLTVILAIGGEDEH